MTTWPSPQIEEERIVAVVRRAGVAPRPVTVRHVEPWSLATRTPTVAQVEERDRVRRRHARRQQRTWNTKAASR